MKIECPKCNGKRIISITPFLSNICLFCHGDGNVDWIERIVGKGPLTHEKETAVWQELLSHAYTRKSR